VQVSLFRNASFYGLISSPAFSFVCYVCELCAIVLHFSDLPDDPEVNWSKEFVAKLMLDYVKNYYIDLVSCVKVILFCRK